MRWPIACIASLALLVGGTAQAREPDIALKETGAGRWRLEYRLEEPARSLRFTRSLRGYRKSAWRPADPAFVVAANGASVRRADGAWFHYAAFDIDAKSLGLASNYEPFLRYSDGGLLLYTGYYFACADGPCTASASWRVAVEPLRRRRATRGAPTSPGRLRFVDKGDGSFVYVGTRRPAGARDYMALADPALPPVVQRSMSAALPRIMDYYRKRLGELPRKPVFFVSLGGSREAGGYESRGAALPDQVSIHLAGPRWREAHGAFEQGFLPWYFAHEAAHLFQRIEDRPNADDFMAEGWIHEGGAEALAALAVGSIDPGLGAYAAERLNDAALQCDERLRDLGAPLNASIDRGAQENYYVCGLAMQMAIDRDVRDASHGARDLLDVWRSFLAATGRGDKWNEANFLAAARAHGARDETLRLVSALARKRTTGAGEELKSRLLSAPTTKPR